MAVREDRKAQRLPSFCYFAGFFLLMSFWILDHVSQTFLSAISHSSLRSPEHGRLRTLPGWAEALGGGAMIANKGEGNVELS